MRQFSATEVKGRWAELLRQAEAGETIAITRRGKVVAQLSPAGVDGLPSGPGDAQVDEPSDMPGGKLTWSQWLQRVKERRTRLEETTVSTDEILSWIREGRR